MWRPFFLPGEDRGGKGPPSGQFLLGIRPDVVPYRAAWKSGPGLVAEEKDSRFRPVEASSPPSACHRRCPLRIRLSPCLALLLLLVQGAVRLRLKPC